MQHGRAILIAILAICLAVFPAGMSRALMPAHAPRVLVQDVAHAHEGHDHGSAHVHGSAAEEPEIALAGAAMLDGLTDQGGDCSHGDGSGDCGKTCCGFACHAFAPVMLVGLNLPSGRTSLHQSREDRQVDDGLLFSIERPPRSV